MSIRTIDDIGDDTFERLFTLHFELFGFRKKGDRTLRSMHLALDNRPFSMGGFYFYVDQVRYARLFTALGKQRTLTQNSAYEIPIFITNTSTLHSHYAAGKRHDR